MELTDTEKNIIKAFRAGAEVSAKFFFLESEIQAECLVKKFTPNDVTSRQEAEGSVWYANDTGVENVDFEVVAFMK